MHFVCTHLCTFIYINSDIFLCCINTFVSFFSSFWVHIYIQRAGTPPCNIILHCSITCHNNDIIQCFAMTSIRLSMDAIWQSIPSFAFRILLFPILSIIPISHLLFYDIVRKIFFCKIFLHYICENVVKCIQESCPVWSLGPFYSITSRAVLWVY